MSSPFPCSDPKLDTACKLLRVLYTVDLRDLQDKIDETLVKLQNITGDPKYVCAAVLGREAWPCTPAPPTPVYKETPAV